MRFSGRVALVSGAGQGIGQAAALRLAREGAAVAVLDRNGDTARSTAQAIVAGGGRTVALEADVARQESVEAAFRETLDRFSRLDVLVNNAGFDRPGTLDRITNDHWNEVLGVHLTGCLNLSRLAARVMREQRSGGIVNVSSVYGKIGAKGEAAYCTAKAGLLGLTKSMARELGPHGVRVNVVLPGLTETPTIQTFMKEEYRAAIIRDTPLGRAAQPDEIAAAFGGGGHGASAGFIWRGSIRELIHRLQRGYTGADISDI